MPARSRRDPTRLSETMESDAFRKSVISGLRWSTASRFAIQGLSWAITLIVVRLLAPHDYGLATQAGIVTGYLTLIGELGLSVGLIQKRVTDEDTLRSVFGVLVVTGTCSFAALCLAAPLVAAFFSERALTLLVRIAAIQFLAMPFAIIPQARLSISLRFKQLSLIGMVSNVVGATVTVILAYIGSGAASLVLGATAIAITRAVALNVTAGFARLPRFEWSNLGPLFRLSSTSVLDRTLWYLYTQVDSILVGRLLGARNLGIYSVAMQLAYIPMERAAEILSSVALPAFASINDRLDRVAAGYMKALRIGSTLGFPVFWGLALVARDLVDIVLGNKWIGVTPVIQVICIAMPLRVLGPIASVALTAIGRPGVSVKILAWGLLIAPGSIAVGTRWGVVGAAAAWALVVPVMFLIAARRISVALHAPLRTIMSTLFAPLCCGVCMVAVVLLVAPLLADLRSAARLACYVALGAASYSLALRSIAPGRLNELIALAREVLPSLNRGR
jgi:teichuronic acid exporter